MARGWDDTYFNEKGELDVELTRECREDPFPENPPTILKWKARMALCRMRLNGVEHDVMACLIDCANHSTGACYPSEEFIVKWTEYRAVKRAIRKLKRMGLIQVIYRGYNSNRYLIGWPMLCAAFNRLLSARRSHQEERAV